MNGEGKWEKGEGPGGPSLRPPSEDTFPSVLPDVPDPATVKVTDVGNPGSGKHRVTWKGPDGGRRVRDFPDKVSATDFALRLSGGPDGPVTVGEAKARIEKYMDILDLFPSEVSAAVAHALWERYKK